MMHVHYMESLQIISLSHGKNFMKLFLQLIQIGSIFFST